MSFLSKLELDGTTYNILECQYGFTQATDKTGKPQGIPQGGEIIIKIESTGNSELLTWMLDHNQTKNGKIIFYRRDAISKLQELVFEKAYCIGFKEKFDANSTQPLQIEMRMIAKKFDLNNAIHEKMWK
ncbi:type VI secretion system tube protein TssD [Chryseobacterium sp. S90]|uniref:type VI secretion system tube protein TssD n=1 Tax=Chryseobacterium sp. S90 TaxID=3395373 RepID=UPI0039BD5DAE